jgi:ribose-phosphate pyrophosphokinase
VTRAQLVFATAPYDHLARDMAALGGWQLGEVERRTFPDGEHYLRIATDPADRDVVLVGGTVDDASTLELYDLACGLVTAGAQRLRVVMPFFGYATMERSVRPNEVVTAKTRARLLSSVPIACGGTQVFLLDLHVDAVAYYFEGGVRTVHVYGKPLVIAAARRLAGLAGRGDQPGEASLRGLGGDDFVLACTDAGRAKWVESLANDLGVSAAFVYKRRVNGSDVEVTGVSALVAGKRVVIYDDMIRTGGSLVQAARAYKEAGAASIDAIATHGIFPGESLAKIRATGLFGRIVTTDSHPRAAQLRDDFLEVESTAALLVAHLTEAP